MTLFLIDLTAVDNRRPFDFESEVLLVIPVVSELASFARFSDFVEEIRSRRDCDTTLRYDTIPRSPTILRRNLFPHFVSGNIHT